MISFDAEPTTKVEKWLARLQVRVASVVVLCMRVTTGFVLL